MKFATFRLPHEHAEQPGATFAAVITETDATDQDAVSGVVLDGIHDVGELLALPPTTRNELISSSLEAANTDTSKTVELSGYSYDTLIPYPSKVFCIGLNYRSHIEETGLETPEYPAVFTKFGQSLTSAEAYIEVPATDHRMDYEGELCVVIGTPGRNIEVAEAENYIAGYAIANDISARGLQSRTSQWDQGKFLEASTPVGPWLATADEFAADARLRTTVNGEVRQDASVDDLVFNPAELIAYLSQLVTLLPGDLILTGTPSGVALGLRNEQGRHPWLREGDHLEVEIAGLGVQRNRIVSTQEARND